MPLRPTRIGGDRRGDGRGDGRGDRLDALEARLARTAGPTWACRSRDPSLRASLGDVAAVGLGVGVAIWLAASCMEDRGYGLALGSALLLLGAGAAATAGILTVTGARWRGPRSCMCGRCAATVLARWPAPDEVAEALATVARRSARWRGYRSANGAWTRRPGTGRSAGHAGAGECSIVQHTPSDHSALVASLPERAPRATMVLRVLACVCESRPYTLTLDRPAAGLVTAILDAAAGSGTPVSGLAVLGPFRALEAEVATTLLGTMAAADAEVAARAACAPRATRPPWQS